MTNTGYESELMLSEADRAALGAFRSFHPAASGMHKVNIAIASLFTLLLLGPAIGFLVAALNAPGNRCCNERPSCCRAAKPSLSVN